MEKLSVLKVLSVISALYQMGEIDSKKKNKLLIYVTDNNETALKKSLYDIRETSNCRQLIDEYLFNEKKGGKEYAEN